MQTLKPNAPSCHPPRRRLTTRPTALPSHRYSPIIWHHHCRPPRPYTGTWPRLLLSRWGSPGQRPWVLINRTHGPSTPGLRYPGYDLVGHANTDNPAFLNIAARADGYRR